MDLQNKEGGGSVGLAIGKVGLFLCGSMFMAAETILWQVQKGPDGKLACSPTAVMCLAELTKLCLAFSFLTYQQGGFRGACGEIRDGSSSKIWAAFAVPGLIYGCTNNLFIMSARYMDGGSLQVLAQLKVVTTSVLWWIIFRKRLSVFHLRALI